MAMMIPDYTLVAEVMLFSEGFADARALSRKMVKLYKLASEQLSQQARELAYTRFLACGASFALMLHRNQLTYDLIVHPPPPYASHVFLH